LSFISLPYLIASITETRFGVAGPLLSAVYAGIDIRVEPGVIDGHGAAYGVRDHEPEIVVAMHFHGHLDGLGQLLDALVDTERRIAAERIAITYAVGPAALAACANSVRYSRRVREASSA
jgi:hypothetical protein